jgi:23S rRNA pseudouridine2605 synthase
VASRRAAEALIRAGRVTVDGRVVGIGERADPARAAIAVDGRRVSGARPVYWIVHKPRGVVTTTADRHASRTVLDLLPADVPRLFPVGRLDRDTEGLVLLTNDGELAHVLLHPSFESEREYRVVARGCMGRASLGRLSRGVPLAEGSTAPARLAGVRVDRARGLTSFRLVVIEGRKRQIRRALATLGHPVVRLVRTRMGPLGLGDLPQGRARRLGRDELAALRRHARARRGRRRPAADRQEQDPSARGLVADRRRTSSDTSAAKWEPTGWDQLFCSRSEALRMRFPSCCALSVVLALAGAPAARAITGVCPDGSIYIVQSSRDIPCPASKQMEPHEVPPLRPNYLPRPYLWEVYRERTDQNNPYNLVDRAAKVRGQSGPPPTDPSEQPAPDPGGAPRPLAQAAPAPQPLPAADPASLGLTDGELRDLFFVVELSQEDAPAVFVQETAEGRERLRISLAHSQAFEARFQGDRSVEGPVLLFSVVASEAETFHPNFTFVQNHIAFRPEASDAAQLGVLQGHFGSLDPNEVLLGYVVLPAAMDLAHSMDVYWNDRQLEVTFGQ